MNTVMIGWMHLKSKQCKGLLSTTRRKEEAGKDPLPKVSDNVASDLGFIYLESKICETMRCYCFK